MTFPVLAIVDKQETQTVIWRVETTPGFAPLSGAWIADEEQAASLVRDAEVIEVGGGRLEAIARALDDAGVAVPAPDDDPAYTGEPAAQAAWQTAIRAAELVEAWQTAETRRRAKDGDTIRPLPTPAT